MKLAAHLRAYDGFVQTYADIRRWKSRPELLSHFSPVYRFIIACAPLCTVFADDWHVLNGQIFVVNRERDNLNASKYPLLIWRFKLSGW